VGDIKGLPPKENAVTPLKLEGGDASQKVRNRSLNSQPRRQLMED